MITGNPLKGQIDYEPDLEGFEPRPIALRSSDGVKLAGWEFHERPAPVTFLLAHGWGGFKETLDQQIVFLRREGWDVVAIDFRNHGASEGRLTSLGYHETRDLEAAVAHVRASPHLAQTIFLWGISMGAAAAIRVVERDRSICGLIAESSYLSLRETVRHHARHAFGRVAAWLSPLLIAWARWRTGLDPEALDMERAVARITNTSALFVAGDEDPRMPPATAQRLAERCAGTHKQVFIAPHGSHACLFAESREAYETAVRRFVGEALARAGQSAFRPAGAANPAVSEAGQGSADSAARHPDD